MTTTRDDAAIERTPAAIGPMHRRALRAMRDSPAVGRGRMPTFTAGQHKITLRLMGGLVDRGLAVVTARGYAKSPGWGRAPVPLWGARITDAGKDAIEGPSGGSYCSASRVEVDGPIRGIEWQTRHTKSE